jgi:hypothetical protein
MSMPEGAVQREAGASWLLRILVTLLALPLAIPGLAMMGGDSVAGGVVMALIGVGLTAWIWWQQLGVRVIVRDDGVEYKGRLSHKGIKWSELAGYLFMPQQRQYYGGGLVGVAVAIAVEATTKASDILEKPMAVTLRGQDGTKIRVSGLIAGHKELGNQLSQTATEHVFAHARAMFDAGQPVRFGKLTVSREGLRWDGALGEKVLPFQELERAQMIEKRVFTLRKHGKTFPWLRVQLARIDSPFAVVRLLNHAREAQLAQPVDPVATGTIQQG